VPWVSASLEWSRGSWARQLRVRLREVMLGIYSTRCMAKDGVDAYNGRVVEERYDDTLWQGCGQERGERRAA
jgi:hypothetical protein